MALRISRSRTDEDPLQFSKDFMAVKPWKRFCALFILSEILAAKSPKPDKYR